MNGASLRRLLAVGSIFTATVCLQSPEPAQATITQPFPFQQPKDTHPPLLTVTSQKIALHYITFPDMEEPEEDKDKQVPPVPASGLDKVLVEIFKPAFPNLYWNGSAWVPQTTQLQAQISGK